MRDEPLVEGTAHPDVLRVLARFAAAGVPSYDRVDVLTARALLEGVTRLQRPPEPLPEVRGLLVDGADGLLPARVYVPEPGPPAPVVVYLHGGGWVLGSVRAADGPVRALARASGCVVVSVEYRRAPETAFPGPLEDCLSAVRWVAARSAGLGGDGRVVVMGDSAGGNLAAATALCLRDGGEVGLLAAQVLLYPCLTTPAGREDAADGPLLSRAEMAWFWGHYARSVGDDRDPRAAPLLAEDLTGLPPATIVVAGLDVLRPEGLAYAERLRAAGVQVDVLDVPGAAHGFWWMDAAMEQADELTRSLGRVLRLTPAGPPV